MAGTSDLRAALPPGLNKKEVIKALRRADPAFYAATTLRGPETPPYNGEFLISEHHQEWSELIREHDWLCVQSSRGSGKTFFFNLAYPLWQAERNPGWGQDNYGVIFSGSDPQAQRILTDIKAEVEQNPKLAHLLPDNLQRNWGVKMVQFKNGFRLYAKGWGSKTRGLHPKFVVLDDVLNDNDMLSSTMREKNISYFLSAVKPMLDRPDAQVVVVGTPFAADDLYGYLANSEDFVFRRYSAIKEDGTSLWPDKFSIEHLEKEEKLLGRTRFAREYMCQPVSEGSSLFPLGLFTNGIAQRPEVTLGRAWDWWEKRNLKNVFMGVDLAISRNVGADYTVLFIVALDDHGNRWILDIIRERGMAFHEQLDLIRNAAAKYRPGLIAIENNQMQRIFEDELTRTTDLPIKGVHTGREKSSLVDGIPYIATLLENGKYRIPRGDDYSIQQTDIWISEMHSFTFDAGKVISVGKHDDSAMACFVCEKAIKEGMFSFAFGEEEGDDDAFQEIMQGLPLAGLKQNFEEMMGELTASSRKPGGAFETGDPELDVDLDDFVLRTRRPNERVDYRTTGILVNNDTVQPGDRRNATKRANGGGMPMDLNSGAKPTSEVLPEGGSPKAADILGGFLPGGKL